MNKIEKMLKEMCPGGVERKKIKDVYKRLRGTPITASKMNEIADDNGDIRIFAGGKTVINAFEKDIPNANITKVPALIIQSRGVIDCIYYDKPFTFKNEMWAYTADNIEEIKFLFYLIKNDIEYFRDAASGMGSMPQISLAVTEEYEIPVPPIEVQGEIVRILDNFTELTAEREARVKQYEYYRDKLLNVDDVRKWGSKTKTVKLGEIAEIGTGSSNTNEADENGKYPFYVRSQEPLLKNDYEFDETAIITAGDGNVGKVYHFVEGKYALHQRAYRIHIVSNNIMPKYLFHYIKYAFGDYINREMYQSSVSSIRRPMLNNFLVPVPSLEVQKKLVNVLDHFESICSDLNIGLPAEIEDRKKQYEYYRDKLLTFK